jgi:hypothetical protein
MAFTNAAPQTCTPTGFALELNLPSRWRKKETWEKGVVFGHISHVEYSVRKKKKKKTL